MLTINNELTSLFKKKDELKVKETGFQGIRPTGNKFSHIDDISGCMIDIAEKKIKEDKYVHSYCPEAKYGIPQHIKKELKTFLDGQKALNKNVLSNMPEKDAVKLFTAYTLTSYFVLGNELTLLYFNRNKKNVENNAKAINSSIKPQDKRTVSDLVISVIEKEFNKSGLLQGKFSPQARQEIKKIIAPQEKELKGILTADKRVSPEGKKRLSSLTNKIYGELKKKGILDSSDTDFGLDNNGRANNKARSVNKSPFKPLQSIGIGLLESLMILNSFAQPAIAVNRANVNSFAPDFGAPTIVQNVQNQEQVREAMLNGGYVSPASAAQYINGSSSRFRELAESNARASENITWKELFVHTRNDSVYYSEPPSAEQLNNLYTMSNIMEVIRHALGDKEIVIVSGYRPDAYNRTIPGAATGSQHTDANAIDFYVEGMNIQDVERAIDGMPISIEYSQDTGKDTIHVDNRMKTQGVISRFSWNSDGTITDNGYYVHNDPSRTEGSPLYVGSWSNINFNYFADRGLDILTGEFVQPKEEFQAFANAYQSDIVSSGIAQSSGERAEIQAPVIPSREETLVASRRLEGLGSTSFNPSINDVPTVERQSTRTPQQASRPTSGTSGLGTFLENDQTQPQAPVREDQGVTSRRNTQPSAQVQSDVEADRLQGITIGGESLAVTPSLDDVQIVSDLGSAPEPESITQAAVPQDEASGLGSFLYGEDDAPEVEEAPPTQGVTTSRGSEPSSQVRADNFNTQAETNQRGTSGLGTFLENDQTQPQAPVREDQGVTSRRNTQPTAQVQSDVEADRLQGITIGGESLAVTPSINSVRTLNDFSEPQATQDTQVADDTIVAATSRTQEVQRNYNGQGADFKVLINPGHYTGIDPGAVADPNGIPGDADDYQEVEAIDAITPRVIEILEQQYGVEVVNYRSTGLQDITDTARANDVNYYVSIHANTAARDPNNPSNNHGYLILENGNQALANSISEEISNIGGIPPFGDNPVRQDVDMGRGPLHITQNGGTIIELGFIDSPQDREFLQNPQNAELYAQAIARGIVNQARNDGHHTADELDGTANAGVAQTEVSVARDAAPIPQTTGINGFDSPRSIAQPTPPASVDGAEPLSNVISPFSSEISTRAEDLLSTSLNPSVGDIQTVSGEVSLPNHPVSQEEFFEFLAPAAQRIRESGLRPSVAFAQFWLETGGRTFADGEKFEGTYNIAGRIHKDGETRPAVAVPTWEEVNGRRVETTRNFVQYESYDDCINAYMDNLLSNPAYEGIEDTDNLNDYLRKLRPYATDSQYTAKLLEIIQNHNLERFDEAAPVQNLARR